MPLKDPEARKQYNKEYRLKHLAEYTERDREYRESHKDEIYERNKKYVDANRDKHRKWVRKATVKWRKEHGSEYYKRYAKKPGENVKHTARVLLNTALKEGKVKRPSECSRCGKKCKPQAHHPNYSKPLEVIWLCGICHKQEHALL